MKDRGAQGFRAPLTEEYLKSRAKRGSRRKFDKALSKVQKVEPDAADRLDLEDG